MPRTVGPFSLNGWRKVVGIKRVSNLCSRFTLRRVCRIPLRPVRKRRTSLETRLALKPGRKPSRQPQSAGRVLLWPAGATSAQASQWWAEIRSQAQQAARRPRSRPVPTNLGTGRTIFVHFRHTATSRRADETQTGKTRLPRFVACQPEAQPMKLPKPMIILGQIQQVTEQTMTDKRDPSRVSKLFLVVFSDKTKPAQFRTSTPFCRWVSRRNHAQPSGRTVGRSRS